MLDVSQLRDLIITPALALLPSAMRSPAAVELLIGTELKESGGVYVRQLPDGPALGLYQMEPVTYEEHQQWILQDAMLTAAIYPHGSRPADDLMWDVRLATQLARVHYWVRGEDPLPALGDVEGYALYWGVYYQTQAIPEQMAQFV